MASFDDSGHVHELFDDAVLLSGVLFDRCQCALRVAWSHTPVTQEHCPAQYALKRRAQLVRENRNEVVLGATHPFGFATETDVFQ
jgi:hypothetical protein